MQGITVADITLINELQKASKRTRLSLFRAEVRTEPRQDEFVLRTVQANHSFLFQYAFFAAVLWERGRLFCPCHRLMKPSRDWDGVRRSLKEFKEQKMEQNNQLRPRIRGAGKKGGLIAFMKQIILYFFSGGGTVHEVPSSSTASIG